MSRLFEELDYRPTPIGALVLRRRREARLGVDILEIKLGEEHLMSDLFTASEIALAQLGLAACDGESLDVVVGGLGLGYTAKAALDEARTSSLIVVEYLEAVLDWHRTGLLPLGPTLTADPRCRLVEGDFFAMARGEGFDPDAPGRKFDAILLDIDHSPDALLDPRSESFYQPEGLALLSAHLKPGGVFALWSDALPDAAFAARLEAVFDDARAEPVTFDNPLTERPFTQTVYVARKGQGRRAAAAMA